MRKAVFVSLLVLLTCSTGYAFFPVQEIPKPDPNKAKHDNACAMIAADMISGASDGNEKMWKSDCSSDPDVNVCIATRNYITSSLSVPDAGFECKPAKTSAVDPGVISLNSEKGPSIL